jgi:hypothetical protein
VTAEGNFSAADKTLRETSVPRFDCYSYVAHPTMITVGTWSWDLYFNGENNVNYETGVIDFVDSSAFMKLPFNFNGY